MRDAVSFNFSDYLFEFQLFGEPHVDSKEEAIKKLEKMIDESPFIEHLNYGNDCTNDIKDGANCDRNNIIYPGKT